MCGALGAGSPIAAASSALLGLRSSRPCHDHPGVSCGVTPKWAPRPRRTGRPPDPASGTGAGSGPRSPGPPGVRRVPRSDDRQADSEPDQDRAAGTGGAQDEIPEPGIAGHQLPEALDRHREHFARVDRHSGEVGARPSAGRARRGSGGGRARRSPAPRVCLLSPRRRGLPSPARMTKKSLSPGLPRRTGRRPAGWACAGPCASSAAIWASLSRGNAPCRSGGFLRRRFRRHSTSANPRPAETTG